MLSRQRRKFTPTRKKCSFFANTIHPKSQKSSVFRASAKRANAFGHLKKDFRPKIIVNDPFLSQKINIQSEKFQNFQKCFFEK